MRDSPPDRTRALPGLSSAEAAETLAAAGPNVLPAPRRESAWRRIAAQFLHFFALMLWAAAALALAAGLPQLAAAIVLVVILNGIFAFVQEHRAERAAERLRDLIPSRTTVRRDGVPVVIESAGVVPGDVVLLSEGDRITADLECAVAEAWTSTVPL